mgnify:CR=1 FL=1
MTTRDAPRHPGRTAASRPATCIHDPSQSSSQVKARQSKAGQVSNSSGLSASTHHPSHNPYSEASRFSHSNLCSAEASQLGMRYRIQGTGGPFSHIPYAVARRFSSSPPPQLPSQVRVG